MQTTLGNNADALVQAATPVGLIAAAGLVLVPRLWERIRFRPLTISAVGGLLVPMCLVSVAVILVLYDLLSAARSFLVAAIVTEPLALGWAVAVGFLISEDMEDAEYPPSPDRDSESPSDSKGSPGS